ncbi:MAG TPA: twin-arginine translocase TatA/TatE family subunit [Phycisphaerales bacterium]|nr:twin-arginine translocase TatA/TatE family subunit [Phycisphaerales bacterium]
MNTLAFFPQFSGWELLIIAGIALLIFGKRLPEVGRSLGKGIVEFKKGLKGVEEEIDNPRRDERRYDERRYDDRRDLPPAERQPLPQGAAYDDRRVSRERYEQPVAERPATEPPADDRR